MVACDTRSGEGDALATANCCVNILVRHFIVPTSVPNCIKLKIFSPRDLSTGRSACPDTAKASGRKDSLHEGGG